MGFWWLSTKIFAAMWTWQQWKRFVEHSVAFSSDSLHVIVGVLLLLGVALALRKPISSWRPWLVLLVLIGVNEFVDLSLGRWPQLELRYAESVKDLLLTMFLPTLLLLAARWRPTLLAGSR